MASGFRSIKSNLLISRRLNGDRASSVRVIRSLFTVNDGMILRTNNARFLLKNLKNDVKNQTSKCLGSIKWSSSSPNRTTGLDIVSPLIGLTGTK
jgi:hypothetical protein